MASRGRANGRLPAEQQKSPRQASSSTSGSRNGKAHEASAVADLVCLANVAPAEVRYLVEPYLPLGAICLLEGDPSAGKSYLAADFGAAVTRGKQPQIGFAAASLSSPRSVVYLTAEDTEETLRDRFAGQGADLKRVFCLTRPTPLRDVDAYRAILERAQPGLLVIDPIQALLDGVNMNTANTVRSAMVPLIELAARHECSVLVVRHLAKAGRGRAIYRGLGSIDFSALARSVLRIGEDPERPGSRALIHVKNSLGPLGPSVEFEITAEKLTWMGRSELTAGDLDAKPSRSRGKSALDIAKEFLEEKLKDGPKAAKEIAAAAKGDGIAERTLERAAKELGVLHERLSVKGRRGAGSWAWTRGRRVRLP